MDPEVWVREPLHAANPHEPRPVRDRIVSVVAMLGAAGATFAMWREAVDWRATSGEGHIMAWALPWSVVAVPLVLWLITAVLDADRPRAVVVLSTALVVTTFSGWATIYAITSDINVGR